MDLQTKTIFLKESEKDIFAKLHKDGIDTKAFSSKFEHLFQKIYNNEVGYYSFKQDNTLYKFIILPKTIDIEDENKERDFVNYLLHYYRVNNKHGYDKSKKVPKSILSLAFESNNAKQEVHEPLELFEFHKTMSLLKNIEAFFQKHKNYKRVEKEYISQSIKHKLSLSKNIKEINKSKIHQSRKVDVLYSQIATVSYFTLKLYIQTRLQDVYDKDGKLKQKAKEINSSIARKYMIDKSFSLSFAKLHSYKIEKIFQKKDEYKLLLVNLKSLFGYEQHYNDKHKKAHTRHDLYTNSFFIDPSMFYEWYVYDILKAYTEKNGKKLYFDKREKTVKRYYLNSEERSSNPDFIISYENINIIIDSKWKNITKIANILHSDYLKLQFDSSIRSREKATVSYLIYPCIEIADRKIELKTLKNGKARFSFNIFPIDMNFEKDNNSLNFDYSVDELLEEIEESRQIETLKHSANMHGKDIQELRTKNIYKLIDATDEEAKEQVRDELDNQIFSKALDLSEQLTVQSLLPEVEKILSDYEDILEDDSKKFLKSSSNLYSYYIDKDYGHFDYSMPGSGLWKLVELELNTSFVFYIRRNKGVVSKNNCWKPIIDKDDKRSINWVQLNEIDEGGKLKGLMYAQLKFLCRNYHTRSLFNDSLKFDFDYLYSKLDAIVKIRNEHAHIKAMSKEQFNELWNLLFKEDNDTDNLLKRLLTFKRNIRIYIDEN